MKHPEPNWDVHYLLLPEASEGEDSENRRLRAVLKSIDLLDEKEGIVNRGYSLVRQFEMGETASVFHVTAGRKMR